MYSLTASLNNRHLKLNQEVVIPHSNLFLLVVPALALIAIYLIYEIATWIFRRTSKMLGVIIAIPLGIYTVKVIAERLQWQIDFGVYANWLTKLLS